MSNKLTECDDCGGQVSRRAAACPHCGAPRTPEKSPAHLTEVEEEEDQDAIDERRHNEVERILESKKAKLCKYCKAPLAPTTKTCPRCGSNVFQKGALFYIVWGVVTVIILSVAIPLLVSFGEFTDSLAEEFVEHSAERDRERHRIQFLREQIIRDLEIEIERLERLRSQ